MPEEISNEKLPPQDIEAEKSLLGSLMLDKEAITKIADFLIAEDFYKQSHQKIYQAIEDLFAHGEPIDFISVSSKLKERGILDKIGGTAYLTELINTVPTASHVLTYAKIVQKKRILRDLISAGQDISILGYKEGNESEELLDNAERLIFQITQKSMSQTFSPLKPCLKDAFERIEKISNKEQKLRGISTGFNDLDTYLSGLQKSDLIVLAARPSMGKSSLGLDIAKSVALKEGVPVGIFSLEMSKDQLVDRLISSESNVDAWKIRQGSLSSSGEDNDFTKIQSALGSLSDAPIFISDNSTMTVLQMRAMARRLKANHGLGLLVIDYLQLIEPGNKNMSSVQQVTEISRQLKGLARELDIPVLALSQLSRAVEQRTPSIPKLSDLRESGCLTADAIITDADTGKNYTIKELAERKKQNPMNVLSLNGSNKVSSERMTKAFYSGRKTVFELKTKTGRTIKASANHPFFKLEGWKRLDELKRNDYIALPRCFDINRPANPLSNDELILLAHLTGDGCILPRQPFHYTNAYIENIETVKSAAKKLFNIEGRIVKQKNWYHLYLTSPYKLTKDKHHPITNWYKDLGIELVRSYNKKLPEAIFSCDKEKIALFLKHLWATDGNLSWKRIKGRIDSASIYYASSSYVLAKQVQHLLLMLGIHSSLKEKKQKNYRSIHNIYIQGAENQLNFLKLVGINDRRSKEIPILINSISKIIPNPNNDIIPKEAWRLYVEPEKTTWRELCREIETSYCGSTLLKTAISRKRMLRIGNALDSEGIKQLAQSDVFWDRIVSIKKIGERDVYDATVENTHNFIANDIIVHNSIEQDSDVVLFIYREDMYRKETPRKGIADILIAKHRNGPVGRIELYFDNSKATFRNLEKTGIEYKEDVGF